MSLAAGTRIGTYEIIAPLGAGGMGEVYRARDTRLDRDAALKVLPDAVAADPERRLRFEREARMLAALNHPHIAGIYGVEESGGIVALAMELVEGATLADRIARGPIPTREAIGIARQIVDALEAAHERGIIHRDLKPANIMLTADGQVKVLDFGLAKTIVPEEPAGSTLRSLSPTMTSPAMVSVAGLILGTAAYMSPEQAKGREADKRSDVWAFGCVLFEMLTGAPPFGGEDVADMLAAVLRAEPDWQRLPAEVPPHVRAILRRCLEKDRRARIPDIAVVRFQLDEGSGVAPAGGGPRRSERLLWAAALTVSIIGAVAAIVLTRPEPAAAPSVVRFEIAPPAGGMFPGANLTPRMAVSPDGRYLAFTVNLRDGKPDQLWLRRLDSLEATALVTVAEISGEPIQQPFWSPDSRFVGFFLDGKLKKVDLAGRAQQTLADVTGNNFGGTWNADNTIVFGTSGTSGLMRVSAAGGVPTRVTTLDTASGENAHLWPRFLPDGQHFLYQAQGATREDHTIYVGSFDGTRTRVFKSPYMVDFAPPDRLLFLQEGSLLAQRFDAGSLTLQGEPAPIAEGAQASANGRAAFTASGTGVLVYRPGDSSGVADSQLAWVDRSGRELALVGQAFAYRGLALSPDGTRAVVHREDGDLWVLDLERGSTARLTFDPALHNQAPIWSPAGDRIFFSKVHRNGVALFTKAANGVGPEQLVYEAPGAAVSPWAASDAGTLIVSESIGRGLGFDLRTVTRPDGRAQDYIQAPGAQQFAQLSPDGHWVAYLSTESGTPQIYVQSFPKPESRFQISTANGTMPRWRRDGMELFYLVPPGTGPEPGIMSVAREAAGSAIRFGIPRKLFELSLQSTGGHPLAARHRRPQLGRRAHRPVEPGARPVGLGLTAGCIGV
jgi:Tol biopolymer transport system component